MKNFEKHFWNAQ